MKTRSQSNKHGENGDNHRENNKEKNPTNLVIIDDGEEPTEDELDSKGNIKDLIDYEDDEEYQIYEEEMKNREKIIEEACKDIKKSEIEDITPEDQGKMSILILKVVSNNIEEDGDNDEEEDNDSEEDEDDDEGDDDEEDDDQGDDDEKDVKKYNTRGVKRKLEDDFDEASNKRHKPELQSPGDFLNMLLGGSSGSKKDMLKQKVIKSNIPKEYKPMVINRIEHMDADKAKELQWIENILKIPFGKYAKIPINSTSKKEEIETFFKNTMQQLDDCIYGLDTVKEEIINYIAQFISTNNSSMPRILALHGAAGVGKTSIIRNGLAKAIGRPMKCISMGGLRDSSHFLGFDYTYSGSRYGIIAQSIIETGVMNPIIFMDELDKISMSNDGIEIQNLLVHLTDPIQNSGFHDKYFAGIDLDMSKAIFVFSFNNIDLIHPILKDRLHIVKVPDPSVDDKVVIGKRYLLPELCKNIGFKSEEIIINDDVVKRIINTYSREEKGVRELKRCLETLLLRINLARYVEKCKFSKIDKIVFPFTITSEVVETILKRKNPQEDWPEHVKMLYM